MPLLTRTAYPYASASLPARLMTIGSVWWFWPDCAREQWCWRKGQCHHSLRDAGYRALQIVEPPWPQFHKEDDQHAPFVADTPKRLSHPIAIFRELITPVLDHISGPAVTPKCLLAAQCETFIYTHVRKTDLLVAARPITSQLVPTAFSAVR